MNYLQLTGKLMGKIFKKSSVHVVTRVSCCSYCHIDLVADENPIFLSQHASKHFKIELK